MDKNIKLITEQLSLKEVNPKLAESIAKEYKIKENDLLLVRKGLVPADVKIEEGERAVISYITTGTVDRDKEIMDPKGAVLKDYRKHPVVLFGHDYRSLPIGMNEWIKFDPEKNALIAKTIYANTPEAEKVFQYRKDGFPLAESIGFIPLKFEDLDTEEKQKAHNGAKRIYNKWILLEYSDVAIPSNPEALQIAVAKGLIIEKQKFNCECIKCGYKIQSEKHCKDLKCEKCGGQMRRAERPGPGQEGKNGEKIWEDMPNEIRFRIRDPKLFQDDSFKRIPIKQDKPKIFGIAGKLKEDTSLTLQSLRFPKDDDWTLAKAKVWVEAHPDITKDKLEDILLKALQEEKQEPPIEKEGRVLSQKNRALIQECITALSKLYGATEPEPKKEEEYNKQLNDLMSQVTDVLKKI